MTLTVPASGKVLVTMTARIAPGSGDSGLMSVTSTGNCTGGNASDSTSLEYLADSSTTAGAVRSSATYVLSGISAGSHTFRACYKRTGSTAAFADRTLMVMPLP